MRRGRALLPLSPPLQAAHWLQRRMRLAHWPGALSVRAARRCRHGAVQEPVRRAGGAAAVYGPVPLRSPRAVPQVRALRGGLGGPAVPPVHRGSRAGPRRQRRHRTGARGLRPGVLLHLLHRCGRDGRPGGAGSLRVRSAAPVSPAVKYLNAYTGTVLLRCRKDSYRLLCSALPFVRHLESRAQRYPCFLNTLHVGEERQCIQKSLLSCSLTEEQSQSGDEEEDDGTETD
ncbi:ribonuclease P/MRP protein subunit POP5 isoform 2-T2 [Sylvia borin]